MYDFSSNQAMTRMALGDCRCLKRQPRNRQSHSRFTTGQSVRLDDKSNWDSRPVIFPPNLTPADGSVVYNCCWHSSPQSFSGLSPAGLMTMSQIRDSPKLEGQVPIFISPRSGVAQLYPRVLSSNFVASYDSQGYGGGIRPCLHRCEPLCYNAYTLERTLFSTVPICFHGYLFIESSRSSARLLATTDDWYVGGTLSLQCANQWALELSWSALTG
jgi:hypothetical protein